MRQSGSDGDGGGDDNDDSLTATGSQDGGGIGGRVAGQVRQAAGSSDRKTRSPDELRQGRTGGSPGPGGQTGSQGQRSLTLGTFCLLIPPPLPHNKVGGAGGILKSVNVKSLSLKSVHY